MRFQDSQTHANLQTAYENELSAAARYRLAATQARQEGLVSVAGSFLIMSRNAMTHAALWQKELLGSATPGTLVNLRDAARGEFGQWTWKYTAFAQTARQEGYPELAQLFERLAEIACYHNVCFCRLADALAGERLLRREEDTVWLCLACGYVHTGLAAPDPCPVCARPKGWFEALEEPVE